MYERTTQLLHWQLLCSACAHTKRPKRLPQPARRAPSYVEKEGKRASCYYDRAMYEWAVRSTWGRRGAYLLRTVHSTHAHAKETLCEIGSYHRESRIAFLLLTTFPSPTHSNVVLYICCSCGSRTRSHSVCL